MFVGYSGGSGWEYGLWSVLVGVGNAVFGTLLAWLVLADRTRDLTRVHHIKSMPQLFSPAVPKPWDGPFLLRGDLPVPHPLLRLGVQGPDQRVLGDFGH